MGTFRACRIALKDGVPISSIWSREVCEQIIDFWVREGRNREDYEIIESEYCLPDDYKEVVECKDLAIAVILRETISAMRRREDAERSE